MTSSKPLEYPHVTISYGGRGCYAVLMGWNNDSEMGGFPEPFNTGMGSYKTPSEAAVEGRMWAEAEGIPFYE